MRIDAVFPGGRFVDLWTCPKPGPFAFVEMAALLLAAPLLAFPNRFTPVALALLPVLWLVQLLTRRVPMDGLTHGSLLLFAIMVDVSLLASADLALSLPKVDGLILGLYVFRLAAHYVRQPFWRKGFVVALVGSGLGIALVGLVGTNWSAGKLPIVRLVQSTLPRMVDRVPASHGVLEGGFGANEVGGTLALLVPVGLALALFVEHRAGRLVLGTSGVVMLGVLALTLSRSALLGLVAGAAVVVAARWPRCLFALPALLPAAVGLVLWAGPDSGGASLPAVFSTSGISVQGRLDVWERAFQVIQDFPLTGVGLNTFPVVADALYPSLLRGMEMGIPHVHNFFLQVAVDFGLPGLLGVLGLLVAATVNLIRGWRAHRGWEQGLIVGLGAGLLAHLVFGLTDAVTLGAKPGVLLWALLGGAVALQSPAQKPGALSRVRAERATEGQVITSAKGQMASIALGSYAGQVFEWLEWGAYALACALATVITLTNLRVLP